jgi:hypothetical protein
MLPLLFGLAALFPRPRWKSAAVVLAATAVMILLVSRVGQRGLAFNFILSALVIVHYLYKRIPSWLVFVLVFVALALGNLLGS